MNDNKGLKNYECILCSAKEKLDALTSKEFGIDKDVFFDPKALSRNKKTIVN